MAFEYSADLEKAGREINRLTFELDKSRTDHQKKIAELEDLAKELAGALKEYAQGNHFEFCGLPENEPESASGEPVNWLCGGDDGHEYQYEDGAIAREALKKAREKGLVE